MKQLQNSLPVYFDHQTDLPFDIHTIKWMEDNCLRENNIYNRNNHFLFIWITKGAGNYSIGNQKGVMTNNDLLYVKPGQFKNMQLPRGLEGYVISFTSSFLDLADPDTECILSNLFQLFASTNSISINNDTLDDMQHIISIMAREFNMHNLYRSEILKRYFKIFLIYLSRQSQIPAQNIRQSRNEEIVNRFMTLLENNFKTQKMVADYAEALSVTPNYLNEVIKKTTGNSAGHHIRQRVALEAKRQVIYSNICMKNIAYDLGFYDMAHFSKFFKNATGMNFSDFKNQDRVLQSVA
jgi:AraC family transcriptional activator of pobA